MMKIGGLQKVSLIDYPGKISAIIFTQGCNFRCPYCHNPELVDPKRYQACLSQKDILDFLALRVGKLDAVTITGGEPTIQNDLIPFIRRIRKMDYEVKLDTNGTQPEILDRLLKEKLLDYIAMDVKAPLEHYSSVVNAPVHVENIRQSVRLALKSNIPHEFRTTVVSSQLTTKDISIIVQELKGAKRYVLQKYRPTKMLHNIFLEEKTYSDEEFLRIAKELEKDIPMIVIR